MKFIRIEHPNTELGIFRHEVKLQDLGLFELLERHQNFPTPNEERRLYGIFKKRYKCAFKTVEQLKRWIYSEEIEALLLAGFEVYVMTSKFAIEGDYQIIFDPELVTLKENISDLFRN